MEILQMYFVVPYICKYWILKLLETPPAETPKYTFYTIPLNTKNPYKDNLYYKYNDYFKGARG